ncbi:MAG: hypothetical protein LBP39_02560, partial [Rickettsiales bacterium]|nr:hypothetical protein [Rickettsiales bacterium]
VSDRAAFNTARYLAKNAILIGGSAGGVVYQASRVFSSTSEPIVVVINIIDAGEKYVDTLFNDVWMREKNLLDDNIGEELSLFFNF